MAEDTAVSGYCQKFIAQSTLEKLQAGAFEQLCEHLRERSDEVQNIDLMTISGFCRNCLAKWMVVEARRLSDKLKQESGGVHDDEEKKRTIQALDALGYDEAAEYVYGMTYGEWKKRYNKKASDAVMEKYNASQALHAKHDKDMLAVRGETPSSPLVMENKSPTMLSNVCCQDPELLAPSDTKPANKITEEKRARVANPQVPLPPPGNTKFTVAILTISDRAASGEYKAGDLSGPAVEASIATSVEALMKKQGEDTKLAYDIIQTAVVPDDVGLIRSKLKEWSTGDGKVDLILTTGGTGFAPRDVTPEATSGVLDRECHGLMSFISSECSKMQPLAALSRGTAGVCGRTFVANLPGNPTGVGEIVPLLLPLTLHAIRDLQET